MALKGFFLCLWHVGSMALKWLAKILMALRKLTLVSSATSAANWEFAHEEWIILHGGGACICSVLFLVWRKPSHLLRHAGSFLVMQGRGQRASSPQSLKPGLCYSNGKGFARFDPPVGATQFNYTHACATSLLIVACRWTGSIAISARAGAMSVCV